MLNIIDNKTAMKKEIDKLKFNFTANKYVKYEAEVIIMAWDRFKKKDVLYIIINEYDNNNNIEKRKKIL